MLKRNKNYFSIPKCKSLSMRGYNTGWFSQKNLLQDEQQPWLLYPGSFIKKVKQHHKVKDVYVQVLKQKYIPPEAWESKLLNVSPRHVCLVREVFIFSKNKSWMFARAVFPLRTLTGHEKRFAYLHNKSLGSVLFRYPKVKRTNFEFAFLKLKKEWIKKLKNPMSDNEVICRRSIFHVKKDKPILLTEYFLPDVCRVD